jgi:hypothetical protein
VLTALLSVTTAVLTPPMVIVGMALLPFSDRVTQAQILGMWFSYATLVGVVLL